MRVFGSTRRPPRQQTIASHGEEDAGLPVLEHQQHGGHRDGGTERHDPADAQVTGELERARQRVGHRQLRVRHHAGQHRSHDHVDDRADGEPPENADRQVALRVLRFFCRRRDGIEADVREEDDRRALMDAREAIGCKRRVVGRLDGGEPDGDEEAQRQQLDHHHHVVRGGTLPTAYSRIRSQPTIQATSSPSVAYE